MNETLETQPLSRQKAAQVTSAMVAWIQAAAPWEVVAHLTFPWEASVPSAQRCYQRFMKQEMWGVSYYYAVEQNPGGGGCHIHAVWCDFMPRSCSEISSKWFTRYGQNRIEPIRDVADVSAYCTKYATDRQGWWDVKLLGHRHPRNAGVTFRGH